MSMNNLTVDGEFRYIVQWFNEWSELQRDDFIPVLLEYLKTKVPSTSNDSNNSSKHNHQYEQLASPMRATLHLNGDLICNEIDKSLTLTDRPMSLFQCRIKLFRQWHPKWPMEFQQRLQQKIAEIDPIVYEKLLHQLLPLSATTTINAVDDVNNFNDFHTNNTIVKKNLEQTNAVSNVINVANHNNNASNTDNNNDNNNDDINTNKNQQQYNNNNSDNDVQNEINLKVINDHAVVTNHHVEMTVEATDQLAKPMANVSTDIEGNGNDVVALSAKNAVTSSLSSTESSVEQSLSLMEHGAIPLNDGKVDNCQHINMDNEAVVDTEEEDPVKPVASVQLSNSNDNKHQPLLVHETNSVCNNLFQTEMIPQIVDDQQHDQLSSDAIMVKHTPNQSSEVPLLA